MGVQIDEARSDDQVGSVKHSLGTIRNFPHCGNPPVRNRHIPLKPWGTSAINDGPVLNEQIVWHLFLLISICRSSG